MNQDLKRILLVEDSIEDVELALAAMEENSHTNEVVVVRDGVEALDYLHCRSSYKLRTPGLPALVLLDVNLPRMNGLEVLEEIKGHESLRRVPVVMLTASNAEEDLDRAYGLGANAYVVKPVSFQDYVVTMKDIGAFWAVANEPPTGCVGKRWVT